MPKALHDSHLPAIIGTASPNLHTEPRRRSDRVKEPGALSLSPATSGFGPHPGTTTEATHQAPVAQWIEQAPSKRLAAGSSPAGGARLRPPSGEGFLLVRAGAGWCGEAPGALSMIKNRVRGCRAVTGFSRVALSNTCRSFGPGSAGAGYLRQIACGFEPPFQIRLPVQASGVRGEEHSHAVPGPLSDLGGRDLVVEPLRQPRVPVVVHAAPGGATRRRAGAVRPCRRSATPDG